MKASIACNAFVAVMTVVAFVLMTVGWGSEHAVLNSTGVENLKYFTVLSNLLSGVACAVLAVALVRTGGHAPLWMYVLKLAATTAVSVTFLTVVVLFMGVWGLGGMFNGANFWFHLVLPLVAIVGFCALDTACALRFRATFAGMLPTALYGIGYYANIIANGVGEWPDSNDWYGFLSFGGLEAAPAVFAAMLVASWLIALVVWGVNRLFARVGR